LGISYKFTLIRKIFLTRPRGTYPEAFSIL